MNGGGTDLRKQIVKLVIGTDDLQYPAALPSNADGAIDPGVLGRDAPFKSPPEKSDPDGGCQRRNEQHAQNDQYVVFCEPRLLRDGIIEHRHAEWYPAGQAEEITLKCQCFLVLGTSHFGRMEPCEEVSLECAGGPRVAIRSRRRRRWGRRIFA